MGPALLMAVQMAAAPALDGIAPVEFDLARVAAPQFSTGPHSGCAPAEREAILVCGRRLEEAFPLARMEERYGTRPLVAEMRLFGDATARLYAETAALDRGAVAQRIMIGFRLPF